VIYGAESEPLISTTPPSFGECWLAYFKPSLDGHIAQLPFPPDQNSSAIYFFLQPFDIGEERVVRNHIAQLSGVEKEEDWANEPAIIPHRYLWLRLTAPKTSKEPSRRV